MISSNFGGKTHFSFWINSVGFQQKKSAKVGGEVKRFRSAWGRFCVRNRPGSKNFRLSVHFSTASVTSILTWYLYKSLHYFTELLNSTLPIPKTSQIVSPPFLLGLLCKSIMQALWSEHWYLTFCCAEQKARCIAVVHCQCQLNLSSWRRWQSQRDQILLKDQWDQNGEEQIPLYSAVQLNWNCSSAF